MNNKNNMILVAPYPQSGSLWTIFCLKLEFGDVGYLTGVPLKEKPLKARKITNNKLNQHEASLPLWWNQVLSPLHHSCFPCMDDTNISFSNSPTFPCSKFPWPMTVVDSSFPLPLSFPPTDIFKLTFRLFTRSSFQEETGIVLALVFSFFFVHKSPSAL